MPPQGKKGGHLPGSLGRAVCNPAGRPDDPFYALATLGWRILCQRRDDLTVVSRFYATVAIGGLP
jgi:hypothetical protein